MSFSAGTPPPPSKVVCVKPVLAPFQPCGARYLCRFLKTRPNVLKLFTVVNYEFLNKLECLSLAGLSILL
jgi:hypothetical protein